VSTDPTASTGPAAHALLDIPAAVRGKAAAFGATRWLTALPDLIAGLERDWSIAVGRCYKDSTEALVADVTQTDGTPAVLKLCVPRPGAAAQHEITVLRVVNGDGCPRLLRDDLAREALLLERLGRPMNELGLSIERRHELLCSAAKRIWRPAAGCGLPSGAWKGRWLVDAITTMWEALGRPCHEQSVEHALACATRRVAAHDDERAVLVHGDIHEWNALETGDGFKLVDPDGLLAEAEYDMGILMREDPVELMRGDPRDRARWLARRCGLDATAIWEWGVIERVSTGLLCTQIGLQPVGRQMLATADQIAAHHAD
jgi:streptomycin 6-kinase